MKYVFIVFILFKVVFAQAQQNLIWNNLYSKPNFDLSIDATSIDSLGNVLILCTATSNITGDADPVLLKYDPAGNLILEWSNNDSTVREFQGQIAIDSLNNIYIVTYCMDTSSYVRLTKLNGNTGQTEFSTNLAGFSSYFAFGLHDSFLYLTQSFPINNLYKFDLQGNLISTGPIAYFSKYDKLLFSDNYLYLLGDSASGGNFVKRLDKMNFSGQLIASNSININNIFYSDAFCSRSDDYYFTGYTTAPRSTYYHWNSQFLRSDSLMPIPSGDECLSSGSETDIYWCYSNGNFMNILQMAPFISSIGSTDSLYGNFVVDMNMDLSNELYLFTSIKGQPVANLDYQISSFNSSGSLNWTFNFSNDSTSIDISQRIFNQPGEIYALGYVKHSPNPNRTINLFKIAHSTGINEMKHANNYIYPNPISDNYFNFTKEVNSNIELYTITGQLIFETYLNCETMVSLPAELKKGAYLLKFNDGDLIQTIKIINQ